MSLYVLGLLVGLAAIPARRRLAGSVGLPSFARESRGSL